MEYPDEADFDPLTKIVSWSKDGRDYEYDTLTGKTRTIDYKEKPGTVMVYTDYQVGAIRDQAQKLRSSGSGDKALGKVKLRKYASLSDFTHEQMLKARIHPNDTKAMFQYVNKYAPGEKVTDRWHDDNRAKKRDTKIIIR